MKFVGGNLGTIGIFFSRNVVLGGDCFCGERKFVIVWGGNLQLGGGKALEKKKNTDMPIIHFPLPLHQDANAWSLLGHTHFLMGDFPSAKDCYERTVDYVTRPAHLHTVYLRLADIYLREQQVCVGSTTEY